MNNSFEPAIRAVLKWEGGQVNHPDDPGGKTKYGISKAAHPDVDFRTLTEDKARKIYRADYWTPAGCNELPFGLDLLVFDTAVNCGVTSAILFLQEVVGTKQDGIFGPKTKSAAHPDVDFRTLTEDKARKIYRADYWTPAGCNELPFGLDLLVFDTAVNCDVTSAILFLQEVVGTKQDGIFGPKTKSAAQSADVSRAIWEYVARRAIYYTDLSIWDDFGLGWMRRLSEMHQQALKLVKAKG